MGKVILLPCAAFLAAAPATSAPPAVANQIAPSEAQQALTLSGGGKAPQSTEKKICKSLPSSYSRLPNRACLTEREWKQLDADLNR